MMRRIRWAIGTALLGGGLVAAAAETWTEPATGMAFVAVAKGCFQMGSLHPAQPPANTIWDELGWGRSLSENEKPRHEACVDAFWMGKYEVRIKEWRAIMGREAPDAAAGDDDFPVARISWEQAQLFARRLSERSGGRQRFRLPTEAEWEYACRAGEATDGGLESGIDQGRLARMAKYGLGSPQTNRNSAALGAVGQHEANAFGLHDMLGNVWEWVQDAYLADGYARHELYNPRVDAAAGQRVIRGGSFRTEFVQVRCARRGHQPADETLDAIGFRLVRER